MASAPTPATHAAAVYVAAVPLRGPKGPAQALMSAGYSLGLWDLQHFMVLIRPDPARTQALVFDFQPRDPEDALAAFAVLSRSKIPGKFVGAHASMARSSGANREVIKASAMAAGVVRRRTLRRVPDTRCWLVGRHRIGGGDAAVLAADAFSARWPTDLVVGRHDCRDFTNGLVEELTGEKRVLDALRSSVANGDCIYYTRIVSGKHNYPVMKNLSN
uniref:Uncharacterized protein n=1 Tax=Oryza punctata TaxID=4537 RepID=A0A0E0K1Q4_ORYPU